MRRRFTEKTTPTAANHRRFFLKRGWIELGTGLTVLALLLLGNLVACVKNKSLRQEDWPYSPPQWRFLQRLLFRPIDTKTAPLIADPFTFGLDHFTDDNARENAGEKKATITSVPAYAAVVGKPYHYRVEISGDSANFEFQLRTAPSGMNIDHVSGEITWTPLAEEVGKHEIKIIAANQQGVGVQQSYSVYATKSSHAWGTDVRGRDLLAAITLGSKWTLLPGLVAVSIATLLGLTLGGFAGYYGGRIDAGLGYLSSLSEALPSLVLIFLAAAIFHFNIYPVMAVVGLIRAPRLANAIRGKVLSLKAQQFIEASRELGLSDAQILWKDIVWYNARPLLLTQISYGFAFAILLEVTLSYLNFGVQAPQVSWGNMLAEGRGRLLHNEFWLFFFPSAAIVGASLGFYLLGDGVNRIYKIKGD
jgi:peptide/nickel transport system permease protein